MNPRIDWGGPAFPTPEQYYTTGITVREFFAAAALTGLLARKGVRFAQCGRLALDIADSVIKAINEDSHSR